ncbi:MAG: serine hydrolase [Anaerolineae bacterium]|nr:serine hydrolase [Gemmatimonadaceae bacterium]
MTCRILGSVFVAIACTQGAVASRALAQNGASLPDTIARRVDSVFVAYDKPDSPGCALGVYRNDALSYVRGYGMANLEHAVPITPKTVFDIGSTSKQFTAMSVSLLARDGKLSLDDDIRKLIPEMPVYKRPVTVRQLVHHTGGVRDYLTLMDLRGIDFDGVTTDKDALDLIVRQKETNFEPGSEHLYSNSGYFLLSEIVKRQTGETLSKFAQTNIFTPLGMSRTHIHDDHTMIVPGRATGYAPRDEGGFEISMSGFEQTGDGAVMTTVEDLLLWDRNFYSPKVGDTALIAQLQIPGKLNDGKQLTYAAGLTTGSHNGMKTVRHGGSWAGYRAELLRFPERHVSVAVLCNLATSNPSTLADRVATIVLGPQQVAGPISRQKPSATKQPSAVKLSSADLARFTGSFRNTESGDVLDISIKNDKLLLSIAPYLDVVPVGASRFEARGAGVPIVLTFEPSKNGGGLTLRLVAGTQKPSIYAAFTPVVLTEAQLAEYAGQYYSEELDATYAFSVDSGALTLRRTGAERRLQPTVADSFSARQLSLRFTRGANNRVTGVSINAGRVRNIRFEKR